MRSSIVGELELEGLAVREPDEADRRRNTIRITADGAQAMAELGDLVSDAQDALPAPLSAAERRELSRLLQRLVEHHAAAGPGRSVGVAGTARKVEVSPRTSAYSVRPGLEAGISSGS
jgi:hypothetical protein